MVLEYEAVQDGMVVQINTFIRRGSKRRGYSSVVEHSTADREVPGSNPGVPYFFFLPSRPLYKIFSFLFIINLLRFALFFVLFCFMFCFILF